jgi:hypothetical protein
LQKLDENCLLQCNKGSLLKILEQRCMAQCNGASLFQALDEKLLLQCNGACTRPHNLHRILKGGRAGGPGTMTLKEIDETYKIQRRIEAEERALESAVMVFTSTFQEVTDQWGLYDGYALHMVEWGTYIMDTPCTCILWGLMDK